MARGEREIVTAVFTVDGARPDTLPRRIGRVYAGHELCHWRLPGRRRLGEIRHRSLGEGLALTLVTPQLTDEGLPEVLKRIEVLRPEEGDEVVVNDVGLFEALAGEGWQGVLAAGRLLTRQRRGAGWRGDLPPGKGAARFLRGSALDSPGFVDQFRSRYGVRRFEIDNLIQGVDVGELPADVRLSVYYPWLFLTATTLCPWTFDGRRWRRGERCSACRGETLVLEPEEGGRTILMGGGMQFLENDSPGVYAGPAVDRWVWQPRIPA